MSQRAAVRIDDAGARVVAHARGAVEVAGVVVLRPDIARVDRLQRLGHEFQRMIDEALVLVAPGIGDARNAQSVLIELIIERDAIALLGSISPTIFNATT